MAKQKTPIDIAFHSRYVVNEVTGCWNWTGSRDKDGYGEWQTEKTPLGDGKYRRVRVKAHRISWQLHKGPIPNGMEVCHRCDNPPCVNPEHLFLGTHGQNMLDRDLKGRQAFGDRQGNAKLTDADVMEIRASSENLTVLAERYGVIFQTISDIKNRKYWKHVPGERADGFRGNQRRQGSKHGMAKVTETDIPIIRARRAAGEKIAAIAADYGITDTMVSFICSRKSWSHVP